MRFLLGGGELQPRHLRNRLLRELRHGDFAHDSQAIPDIPRNPLLQLLQPQCPPLVFDVLGSGGFRSHARPAKNVADASDLIDDLFDLLALDVELLEDGDELFQRHEPDCLFQGLALLHRRNVFGRNQDVVVRRQDLVEALKRGIVETTNFECLDDLVNADCDAIEFLRLFLVHRIEWDRDQRADLREQRQRLRHGEKPGEF